LVLRSGGESREITLLPFAAPLIPLTAAVAVAFTLNTLWIISALLAGFLLHILAWRSLLKSLRATLPVALFALVITLLQLLWHQLDLTIAAKTLAVFWFSATAFRLVPWPSLAGAIHPGSRLSALALYLLFIRHFAFILTSESRRLFNARSYSVVKPHGRWAFRSLAAALVTLFLRAMIRAERFYAAQLLKGPGL